MTERVLTTELEFLVECIKEMRRIQKEHGFVAAQVFRGKMEHYFRLPLDVRSSFVYDELVRLDNLAAGSLKERDDRVLMRIHDMHEGQYFRLDGQLCTFKAHTAPSSDPRDGFFEYACEGEIRIMEYNDCWTYCTEGRMTFGERS